MKGLTLTLTRTLARSSTSGGQFAVDRIDLEEATRNLLQTLSGLEARHCGCTAVQSSSKVTGLEQGLRLARLSLEVLWGGASWTLYTVFRKENRNQLSAAYSDFSSGSDRRCTFSAMPNPW